MHLQGWAKARAILFGLFLGFYASSAVAFGKPVPEPRGPLVGTSGNSSGTSSVAAPLYPQNLWLLQSGALHRLDADNGNVLERRIAANADALSLQPSDGTAWFADNTGINAITLDGALLLDTPIPLPGSETVFGLTVDDANGLLWAVTDSGLHQLSVTGQYLSFLPLENIAAPPAWMRDRGDVWLLADGEIQRVSAGGELLSRITMSGVNDVRAFMPAQDGRGAWMADRKNVVGVNSDGAPFAGPWAHGLTHPTLVDGDGTGGVWLTDGQEIVHLNAAGNVALRSRPVKDGLLARGASGAIRALNTDRRDGSVWIALNHSAHKLAADGALVASVALEKRGGAVMASALHIDDTRPEIWIGEPKPEIYTNDNTPPLSVAYADYGSRVVVDSLGFTLNDTAVTVSCDKKETSADCTPIAPFEDGYHTLAATIEDLAHNESVPDSVRFTVDTIPPTIAVRSPVENLYTNQPLLAIEGDLDEFAYLRLNDADLPIDANFAFATERLLKEGENLLVFRAEDRATNTSELTRRTMLDSTPPALTVNEPMDNLATAERVVNVRGHVDEVATVRVAGQQVAVGSDGRFALELALTEGLNAITIVAEDRAGNRTSAVRTVNYDITPPPAPDLSLVNISDVNAEGYVTVTGLPGSAEPGGYVEIVVYETEEGLQVFRVGAQALPGGRIYRIAVAGDGSFSGDIFVGIGTDPFIEFTLYDSSGNAGTTVVTDTRELLDHTSTIVGAVKGEFSVDPTGAANFRIPIPVPAGAGGMQPDLALLYSSRAGNGHLGVGWSLSGLSAITRCPQTRAQDGITLGVTYGASDRFCLDGQRLELIEGGGAYGAPGTKYHTEIASFQEIIASSGSAAKGPKYFRVRDKTGLIRYYGEANVGPDARIEMEGKDVARLWAISRIEDRFGNYIEFEYDEATAQGREYWPEYVRWYNTDKVKLGEVEFSYTPERPEKSRGYLPGGARSQLTLLMDGLIVRVQPTGEEDDELLDVGRYAFEYVTSERTGRSRIEGIEYCTGEGDCLPKTLLRYQDDDWSFEADRAFGGIDKRGARFVDLDKDGRVDPIYRSGDYLYVRIGSETHYTGIAMDADVDGFYTFMDANADGYLDIVVPGDKDLTRWSVHLWQPRIATFARTTYATFTGYAGKSGDMPLPVDVDGDGRQEIIIKTDSPYTSNLYLNILRFEDDRLITTYTGFGLEREQRIHVIEYNGDGRPDLLVEKNDCSASISALDVIIDPEDPGDGGGGGGGTTNPPPETTCGETAGLLLNAGGMFVDPAIGDPLAGWDPGDSGGDDDGGSGGPGGGICDDDGGLGISPMVICDVEPLRLPVCDPSRPDEFCDIGGWPPGDGDGGDDPYPTFDEHWVVTNAKPVDANGDGLTDVVWYNASDNFWRLVLNTGNGWQVVWRGFNSDISENERNQSQVADINTDGYPDLVIVNADKAKVLLGDGARFVLSERGLPYDDDGWMLLDADSNGIIDLVHKDSVWEIRYGNGASPDLLEEITDGYGGQTRVLYGAIGTHKVNGESIYLGHLEEDEYDVAEGDEQVDFMGPMQVVAAFAIDTGTRSLIFTHYRYRGARMETRGRGFAGFREVQATNENTGIRTTNIHRQAFPFVGMVEESVREIPPAPVVETPSDDLDDVFDGICSKKPWICGDDDVLPLRAASTMFAASDAGDGKIISRTVNSFGSRTYSGTGGYGLFPFASKSVTSTHDFASGELVKTETTQIGYGDFGNATTITVTTTGAGGTEPHRIVTNNTYGDDDPARWCLGRLTRAEVRHDWAGQSLTRVSEFDYAMDGSCQLRSETLEPGLDGELITVYEHDRFGNVTKKTVMGNDGEADVSRITTMTYESSGRFPETISNALNQTETQVWDARYGAKTHVTGPNGLTTEWKYDALGRLVQTISPSGAVTSVQRAWCAKSACESVSATYRVIETNPDGTVKFAFYDRLQRELGGWTTDIGGRRLGVEKVYDLRGRTIAESLPAYLDSDLRCWAYIEYDNLDREVARYTPRNETGCASRGSGLPDLAAVQSVYAAPPANYDVTRTVYSKLTTYTQAANGRVQSRTVYPNGWLHEIAERGVTGAINNSNLPAKAKQDGITLRTLYAYDAQGNTTAVTDPKNNTVTMLYDARGRKKSMIDPDMGTWSYLYNAFGELVSETDAKDQTVTIRYDVLGRMIRRDEPEGETVWAYDTAPGKGAGKLASISGPDGYFEAHAYDALGRRSHTVVALDGEAWWSSWSYDVLGRVTQVSYPALLSESVDDDDLPGAADPAQTPGFSVQYHYDHGRLKSVSDSDGSVLWRIGDLDAAGRVRSTTLGNSLVEHSAFDLARGTLERNTVQTANGGRRLDLRYNWDAVGNLVHRNDALQGVDETFAYDSLDRLLTTRVTLTNSDILVGALNETHAYDAIGNITRKGASASNYVYGDDDGGKPHAVHSAKVRGATQSYAYDANGNITESADREVDWTSFNKPSRIARGDAWSEFDYGPDRARYRHAAYDGKDLAVTTYVGGLYERITGGADTIHRFNVRAGSQVIAVKEVTTQSATDATVLKHVLNYLHRDHLGSVRLVTDASGKVIDRLDYDAWGQRRNYALLNGETPGIDAGDALLGTDYVPAWKQFHRGFTGHEMLDHLGFIHMNGRIYDATIGRFLSADPFVQFPESTQGFNRYTYVGNNPLSYSDPSGYFSLRKALGKALGHIAGYLSFIPGCQVWCSAIAGAVSGYLLTGSLEGALLGAAGGALGAITMNGGGLFGLSGLQRLAIGAFGAGALAIAGGGRFGDGFLNSAIGSTLGSLSGGNPIAAAILGGTAAKIGGGNFASGAKSAFFHALFGPAVQKTFSQIGAPIGSPPSGRQDYEQKSTMDSPVPKFNLERAVSEFRKLFEAGDLKELGYDRIVKDYPDGLDDPAFSAEYVNISQPDRYADMDTEGFTGANVYKGGADTFLEALYIYAHEVWHLDVQNMTLWRTGTESAMAQANSDATAKGLAVVGIWKQQYCGSYGC